MFGTEIYETIPTNLDDLQPGPELGGILACIDVTEVAPYDRVTVLRAHQRQRSFHDAEYYRAMASIVDALGDDHPQHGLDGAAGEIECALHLTRRATETELSFALELQRRLPGVWKALFDGVIDLRRAKTFSYRTAHLEDRVARTVVERVIDHAGRLTTGQLKARLDRVAMEIDPDSARDRYTHRVTDRRMVLEATDAGTVNLLGLDLRVDKAVLVSRRINQMARSLNTKDEPRTMDQLRADVYLDLLLGEVTPNNAVIYLHTDMDTLTALAAHPGDLNGYGPVVSDIARQVTREHEAAEWRYLITDTATGHMVHEGTTNRRPAAGTRRRVEARDQTCVFPGCRMPSVDCDLDHNQRWVDGGPTCECNLHPLCRYHHQIKDILGWTYQALPDGDYLWTTKLGHNYTTSGRSP